MKKTLFPFLFFVGSIVLLQGQSNTQLLPQQVFSSYDSELDWVQLQASRTTTATTFFQQYYSLYELDRPEDMILADQKTSNDWVHYRYHQYYKGIRVEGGTYLLHEKAGQVQKANGHLFTNIQVNPNPSLSPQTIIQKAMQLYPARQYAWDNPTLEHLLKTVKKDEDHSHYPDPELVILDRAYPKTSGQYTLAYRLILYRDQPTVDRRQLWFDAHTGQLLLDINLMHDHQGEEGIAQTRYHGEQTIMTAIDETGQYVLHDSTRGGGVFTYNDNYSTSGYGYGYGELADFTDEDNNWNNVNAEQDEVATDAHFGTMVTYDFFADNFNQQGFDGAASPMISMVHVGDNFNNAFWNGSFMSYGDGDSILFYPLTSIDVVGHEVAHGVTEFSANLIYSDESGALNESFSDIFGKTIEAIYTPDGFSWVLGERMLVDKNNIFRSMADPHLGNDPKFYGGPLWEDGAGVHTNSGVQNYWYYLLCEGGQGVTPTGLTYDVTPIGMEKAMRIAYYNLTNYLTESSGYEDARRGALEAAADLYGFCSTEYLTVAEAWSAVGLGHPVQENDFGVDFSIEQEDACVIDVVNVGINVLNNSCTTVLPNNTRMVYRYQIDNEPVVEEVFFTRSELLPGEATSYTFSNDILNPSLGTHTIKAWIQIDDDPYTANDTIVQVFENKIYQNEDMVAVDAFSTPMFCDPITSRDVLGIFNYQGCDPLDYDVIVPYQISYKNQVFPPRDISLYSVSPGEIFFIGGNFDIQNYGFGTVRLETLYPGDPITDNNYIETFAARLAQISAGWSERFTFGQMDSATLAIQPALNSNNAIQLIDNNYQVIATGGKLLDDDGKLLVNLSNDPRLFLFSNQDYQTTFSMCLNTVGQNTPALLFDFQQTKGDFDWSSYNINPDFATMIQVELDGRLDTLIYGPDAMEAQTYRLDLGQVPRGQHEVTITTLALQAKIDLTDQEILLDGDNVILDNFRFDINTSVENTRTNLETAMMVTPNPSQQSFTLNRKDRGAFTALQISLFDATGKQLQQNQVPTLTNRYEFGSSLIPGIYFLQVVDGKNSGYFKIIKQ